MLAIQRYPRKRWTAILRHYECTLERVSEQPTGEFWRWPWPGGSRFFVPLDSEGGLDTWGLIYILQARRDLAPDDWQFPEGPPPP